MIILDYLLLKCNESTMWIEKKALTENILSVVMEMQNSIGAPTRLSLLDEPSENFPRIKFEKYLWNKIYISL